MNTDKRPTIGLFGTCGKSTWRKEFIARYDLLGMNYFNPQVANWKPEDAAHEAQHLAEDEVILFPITSETYASGSLSEVGFSILQAIRLDDRREFAVFIEQKLDEELNANPVAAKESLRSRALVNEHLRKLRLNNVYVVDSMTELLDVSVQLYTMAEMRLALTNRNAHNKPRK